MKSNIVKSMRNAAALLDAAIAAAQGVENNDVQTVAPGHKDITEAPELLRVYCNAAARAYGLARVAHFEIGQASYWLTEEVRNAGAAIVRLGVRA